MRVLVEEHHDIPLVEVQVTLTTSPASDPDGLEGLTRTSVELMRRGAGGRSRAEIDAALDALGASFEVHVGHDSAGYSFQCLSRNLDAVMAVVGDLLLRPHLDGDEHERLRRENLATLDELRDDDSTLATRYFDRFGLAPHPYGRTMIGTHASLERLARADEADWVQRSVVRTGLVVGFAGDVTEARAHALAERTFGGLPAGNGGAPALPFAAPPPDRRGRHTLLVDKPERAQSQILIGHATWPAAHPEFLAQQVGATVFGGTFTSRLMNEVRVKRGWSYGASFRASRSRAGHSVRMRVFPAAEQTPDTLELVLRLWDEVVAAGVTHDEVEFAKGYMEGSFAFDLATAAERLDRRTETISLGLAEDWIGTYAARLRALSADDVNRAIRAAWRPDSATIVVTCTAESMAPRLEGLPLGEVQVKAYDEY